MTQIVTKETRYFMLVCFCIYISCGVVFPVQVNVLENTLARERADIVRSDANVDLSLGLVRTSQ